MDETLLTVALANIACKYLWRSCFLHMMELELVKHLVILFWLYAVLTAVFLSDSDVCYPV
jgi:hypothetical protein